MVDVKRLGEPECSLNSGIPILSSDRCYKHSCNDSGCHGYRGNISCSSHSFLYHVDRILLSCNGLVAAHRYMDQPRKSDGGLLQPLPPHPCRSGNALLYLWSKPSDKRYPCVSRENCGNRPEHIPQSQPNCHIQHRLLPRNPRLDDRRNNYPSQDATGSGSCRRHTSERQRILSLATISKHLGSD